MPAPSGATARTCWSLPLAAAVEAAIADSGRPLCSWRLQAAATGLCRLYGELLAEAGEVLEVVGQQLLHVAFDLLVRDGAAGVGQL